MPLDLSILSAALEGLEAQKARIDAHIAAVRSQLGIRRPGRPAAAATADSAPAPKRKRRRMSAAGRRRIAEGQRKRWEAVRQAEEGRTSQPKRRKRKLSPEGRARIVAATKKRWAKIKKQTKVAAKAMVKPVKKVAVKASTKAAKVVKQALEKLPPPQALG